MISLNYGIYLKSLGASYYDIRLYPLIKGYWALWAPVRVPVRVP